MKIAKERNPLDAGVQQLRTPSMIACPECHGIETALWNSIRALEEAQIATERT